LYEKDGKVEEKKEEDGWLVDEFQINENYNVPQSLYDCLLGLQAKDKCRV